MYPSIEIYLTTKHISPTHIYIRHSLYIYPSLHVFLMLSTYLYRCSFVCKLDFIVTRNTTQNKNIHIPLVRAYERVYKRAYGCTYERVYEHEYDREYDSALVFTHEGLHYSERAYEGDLIKWRFSKPIASNIYLKSPSFIRQ